MQELNNTRVLSKKFNQLAENEYERRHPLFDYSMPVFKLLGSYEPGTKLRHILALSGDRWIANLDKHLYIIEINDGILQSNFLGNNKFSLNYPNPCKGIVRLANKDHIAAWDNNCIYIWDYKQEKFITRIKSFLTITSNDIAVLPNNELAIIPMVR